ncbi:hypothetical protein GCM10010967_46700 [Dyadobacter beijingensis]|uniref:Secreted protein (Por secretion system target) n=1 Tax=Dyadobacter beijingensis TaxID=365489 RepID=A0ABQ2ICD3_9BACT|nr:T9SS type A sorting domain-containing protein [Dyadobacter beijingensis]GGN06181.1 hypothetical protein GCM10010967_46700 [Dyadobacter beijingensis]
MKNLVIILFVLSGLPALARIFDGDIALDGDPTPYSVINGRYSYYETSPDRYVEFRADRKYGAFKSPQKIKWSIPTGRWEVLSLKEVAGIMSEHLVATSRFPSRMLTEAGVTYRFPPLTGWVCTPVAYPLTAYVPTLVTSVSRPSIRMMWEDPLTWSTGFVPRKYDNVRVSDFGRIVHINSDVFCYDLQVLGLLTGSRPFTLNILGNMEIVRPYGTINPYQVRMGGMSRQMIRIDDSSPDRIYPSIFIIDNPAGIETKYWVDLATKNRGTSIVRFVKGHFCLKEISGGFGRVFIPKVEGANAERFFVMARTTQLSTVWTDSTISRTYFVGIDEFTYTPITLTRRAKPTGASYATSVGLFPAEDDEAAPGRININYIIDAPGVWDIILSWNTNAQSSSYVPGRPVQMMRDPGAWVPVGAPVVPWGLYSEGRYLYSVYQPGVSIERTLRGVWFSLFQTGAKGKARMSELVEEDEQYLLANAPFPNPADARGFRVRISDPKNAKLSLVEVSGQAMRITTTTEPDNMIWVKPVGRLNAGVYQLLIETGGQKTAHRVVFH